MPIRYVALLTMFTILGGAVRAQEVNEQTEKAIKAAMHKVSPTIVQIETSGGTEMVGAGPGSRMLRGTGPTTGVIVAPDGYIVSSAFNFANKPTAVFVTIPGRKERLVAKTVATDHTRMLTLIKVEATGLPVPVAVPKKEMQIGQWAIALGRTLDANVDNPPAMSIGIISALHRIWGKAVQTDAKVSPVNYGGPLIDVDGRVYGILVPANPFAEGDTAGAEWYDSGIGFAIPLEDVFAVLPRLKQGKDLRKGLLGVTPSSRDIYSGYSTVSSVAPESAAARAGVKVGDQIIEVDGKPVLNHAQVLHAMGPKYEGDVVSIKVKRGKEEKQFTNLVLTGSVTAYVIPYMGILPMRDDPELGLEVRYVFPKGPAAVAGLKPGDRIMKLAPPATAGTPTPLIAFAGRDQLMGFLATQRRAKIRLEVKRKEGGKTEAVAVTLGNFDASIPDALPENSTAKRALERPKTTPRPQVRPGTRPPGEQPRPRPGRNPMRPTTPAEQPKDSSRDPKKVEKGLVKRTNQTKDHQYWMFVPENYDPNVAHGLVIWLHAAGAGGKDADDVRGIWEQYCEKYHLILVGPKAENDSGWVASETEFIIKTAREVIAEYTIDRQRVVVHGMGIGGQMAFYMGFNARDLVRGVATTSAVLATQPKDPVINQRLQFFIVAGGKDPLAKDIAKGQKTLADKKFPVMFRQIPEMGKQYLDQKTLDELVRWIDSMDRL